MQIPITRSIDLTELHDIVRAEMNDLNKLVFKETENDKALLTRAIKTACENIYPDIYIPVRLPFAGIENVMQLPAELPIRSVAAIIAVDATTTKDGEERSPRLCRNFYRIPPLAVSGVVNVSAQWAIMVEDEASEFDVIVEVECHEVDDKINYISLSALVSATCLELVRMRMIKRLVYDSAPAATQENAASAEAVIGTYERMITVHENIMASARMPRACELMGIPTHYADARSKVDVPTAEQRPSYIPSPR